MTKIKKISLGNLATGTHEKVLFVLPPNNFLTKNEFNSIPYASFDATGTVHVIPLCLHL